MNTIRATFTTIYMNFGINNLRIIGENLTVDWGNGNTETPTSENGLYTLSHSYTNMGGGTKTLTITLTGDITGLGDYAFSSSNGSSINGFIEVSLPEGITTIGDRCFQYSPIQTLAMPSTLTTIGNFVCGGCSELLTITFKGKNLTTIGTDFCTSAIKLENLTLPDSVSSIGVRSFSSCNFKRFTIPKNLNSIPSFMLQHANLELIRFKWTTPKGIALLNGITESTVFGVPRSALSTYIAHNQYPNDPARYRVYGDTIAEKLVILGETMAINLIGYGITAEADDGLTTLADKILDIPVTEYVTKEVGVNYTGAGNDRPYLPVILTANNNTVDTVIFPDDGTPNNNGVYTYNVDVPRYNDGNQITYTWNMVNAPSGYTVGRNGNMFIVNKSVVIEDIEDYDTPLGGA